MSRSNAAPAVHEHDHPRLRPRPHGAPATRRMSGPAQSAAALAPSQRPAPYPRERERERPRGPQRPPLRLAAGGATIALRVGETAMQISGSRAMDRVVRSRAWIVIVGFGLIGIVAMQVSLLKLNSGIGRAVDSAATLERSNATLKADISRLSSGDRIQSMAGMKGYRMPEPADVTFLTAGDLRSDGFQAARRMTAPNPAITGPAGSVAAASVSDELTGTGETTLTAGTGTGTATDTAVGTASGTATTSTTTGTTTPPAGTTSPTTTVTPPAATTPPAQPVTAQATAPITPQTTSSGGVTTP